MCACGSIKGWCGWDRWQMEGGYDSVEEVSSTCTGYCDSGDKSET